MKSLDSLPSFREYPIRFPLREGFIPTNASVAAMHPGFIFALVCCGDHFMDERGVYLPTPPGTPEDPERFSEQTIYLAELSPDLAVTSAFEVRVPPESKPVPTGDTFRGFRGFDSARLFVWRDGLWSVMCAMGTGDRPGAELFVARIDGDQFADIRRVIPHGEPTHAEKNWMPEVIGDEVRFHYRLGTLTNMDGTLTYPGGRADLARAGGGSQVIPYGDGRLCIVHDFHARLGTFLRVYNHYFVRLDVDGQPLTISEPFTIRNKLIEIVTGMAYHPDGRLMISYGREDADAAMPHQEMPFIATIDPADLESVL